MNRKSEIRQLLKLSPEQVIAQAGSHLVVCKDIETLHEHFAETILDEIRMNNRNMQSTRIILPVGPTGQYPLLAQKINREELSLSRCWFFFMDEYRGEDGNALPVDHPLSFRGEAQRLFFDHLDPKLRSPADQVTFPNENNIDRLESMIEQMGGIDTCYGGIGIHGHIAFNEPEAGVRNTGPRCVRLNDYTVTINVIRSHVGGNLECFPREAYTIGMPQVLGSRRIRLYCRNGCEFDWANTILRLALFGAPGDDYPVTYIRNHDYVIATDQATLATPQNAI